MSVLRSQNVPYRASLNRNIVSLLSASPSNDSPSKIPVPVTPARPHVRFQSPQMGTISSAMKKVPTTPRHGTPATKDMAMRFVWTRLCVFVFVCAYPP